MALDVLRNRDRNTILVGFALSLVSWVTCAAFFAWLAYRFSKQGIPGCIKALLIITLRHLLSPVVAASLNNIVQTEKWLIIFWLSYLILVKAKEYTRPKGFTNFGSMLALFCMYVIVTSVFVSSYPTVSIFKVISYAVPFYSVALGVAVTNAECNWIHYMRQAMSYVVYASVLTIPFKGRFNVVNGDLQGVLNHPNTAGIFLAIFVACLLFDASGEDDPSPLFYATLLASFFMLFATKSRTGMFSAIICLFLYWYGLPGNQRFSGVGLAIVLCLIVGVIIVAFPSSELGAKINSFVFKREEMGIEDIFDSREELMETSKRKLAHNPLFGSGFGVPYVSALNDWKLATNMPYETGNMYYAILGDVGYLGAALFVAYMLSILVVTDKKHLVLFAIPIIISMGEMAFFATNNVAILYYVFYGLCLSEA